MRSWLLGLGVVAAGCGSSSPQTPQDAPATPLDGAPDAPPDAPPDAAIPSGPALFALAPTPALTLDAITLEGTFAAAAQMTFPGNASTAATVLGTHRARVLVPASATAGALSLDGAVFARLAFRRVPFALALAPFAPTYDQAPGAMRTAQLTIPRESHTATVAGNAVYVAGGIAANRGTLAIERAVINADGSLGGFSVIPDRHLGVPRIGHTATLVGSIIYLIGGQTPDGAFHDSVERIDVLPDGTIAKPAIVSNVRLQRPRALHTAAVIGDGLYIFGGIVERPMPGGVVVDGIERATIYSDGSLGPFVALSTKLASIRAGHTTAVIGDFVYMFGGADTNVFLGAERAAIAPDGSLGPFAPVVGQDFVTPRGSHAMAIVGNAVYAMGGLAAGTPLPTIERAAIHPDGTLDPFAALPNAGFVRGRLEFPVVVAGNYLYAISGATFDGAQPATCERAAIDAAATVDTFAAQASGLAIGRTGHTSFASGRSLYILGGSDITGPVGTVERAAVHDDGTLDPFAVDAGVSLVNPRAFHTIAAAGNFVHVIGGRDGTGTVLATMERANVKTDGTLMPFTGPVAALATARERHASLAAGNFMYVLGGRDAAGAALASIERTVINPDGSLPPFGTVPGVALASKRSGHAAVLIGSTIYVIGGSDAANASLSTIEQSTVNSDGSITTFSAAPIHLVTARTGAIAYVVGTNLFVAGGANGATVVDTIERAPITATGLGAFAVVSGVKLGTARVNAAVVSTGDFVLAVGGTSGTAPLATIDRAGLH